MRCCDILISPDTSFIHIASAIDLPTIGLYYKDNFTYWGPKSSINYVVRTNNYDLVFDKVAEHVKEIYVKLEKKWQYNLDLSMAIFPQIKLDFSRPFFRT